MDVFITIGIVAAIIFAYSAVMNEEIIGSLSLIIMVVSFIAWVFTENPKPINDLPRSGVDSVLDSGVDSNPAVLERVSMAEDTLGTQLDSVQESADKIAERVNNLHENLQELLIAIMDRRVQDSYELGFLDGAASCSCVYVESACTSLP